MFQYSPILGHSSIWDLKYTFSEYLNMKTLKSKSLSAKEADIDITVKISVTYCHWNHFFFFTEGKNKLQFIHLHCSSWFYINAPDIPLKVGCPLDFLTQFTVVKYLWLEQPEYMLKLSLLLFPNPSILLIKYQYISSEQRIQASRTQIPTSHNPNKERNSLNGPFIAVHRSTSANASLSQQLCTLRIFVRVTWVATQKTSVGRHRPMQNDRSLNVP